MNEWKDMADWSGLPDVYVTKAECSQGMFWRIEACSVPMAIGPEVRLIRADKAAPHLRQIIAECDCPQPASCEALGFCAIDRAATEDDDAFESFTRMVGEAILEADRARQKFPQPNYVISKVAEEAGEVVKAAIHCAEGRESAENLRGEMKQLIAMLYRLWLEGDQVHGLPPVAPVHPRTDQDPIKNEPLRASGKCRKCGGDMVEGIATGQTYSAGAPDFPGDSEGSTMSPGGPGVVIPASKCIVCGWSVTA